jgi:hypothetical protein
MHFRVVSTSYLDFTVGFLCFSAQGSLFGSQTMARGKREGLIDLLSALELLNIAGEHKNEAFSLWGLRNCGGRHCDGVCARVGGSAVSRDAILFLCYTTAKAERDAMSQKTQ